jgi:outer membrane PBP1 activator LpoA protein
MVFPRAEGSPRPDFDRLYALGIDAYRIVQDLLAGLTIAQTPLDGVTGRISLAPGQQFVRELTSAQFSDGKTVVVPPERQ